MSSLTVFGSTFIFSVLEDGAGMLENAIDGVLSSVAMARGSKIGTSIVAVFIEKSMPESRSRFSDLGRTFKDDDDGDVSGTTGFVSAIFEAVTTCSAGSILDWESVLFTCCICKF